MSEETKPQTPKTCATCRLWKYQEGDGRSYISQDQDDDGRVVRVGECYRFAPEWDRRPAMNENEPCCGEYKENT